MRQKLRLLGDGATMGGKAWLDNRDMAVWIQQGDSEVCLAAHDVNRLIAWLAGERMPPTPSGLRKKRLRGRLE